jgi:hypothetical protein
MDNPLKHFADLRDPRVEQRHKNLHGSQVGKTALRTKYLQCAQPQMAASIFCSNSYAFSAAISLLISRDL